MLYLQAKNKHLHSFTCQLLIIYLINVNTLKRTANKPDKKQKKRNDDSLFKLIFSKYFVNSKSYRNIAIWE